MSAKCQKRTWPDASLNSGNFFQLPRLLEVGCRRSIDHDLCRLFRTECAHTFAQGNLAYRHYLRQINLDRSIEFLQIEQSLGRVANG
jgi:hypothetical protein